MSLENIIDRISEWYYPATHTPQNAVLGVYNEAANNYNLLNHVLLIFKCCIYIWRGTCILNIDILIANLMKLKKRDK